MEWSLADGTVPSTRCARCQRPTPILVHGLGFDCCADNAPPAETLQPDTDEQPVISIRFGLGLLALTAMLAGAHLAWVHAGMPGPSEIITAIMETLS